MRIAIGLVVVSACSHAPAMSTVDGAPTGDDDAPIGDGPLADASIPDGPNAHAGRTVFVIPFENKSEAQIYGNASAPYINGLRTTTAAYATKFGDALPTLPSEPHYIWMEAGTNALPDRTFKTDADPSQTNSTGSADHLATQIETAGLTWMTYQEDITTGTCPIHTSGDYAPKHDPFVFFRDVSGTPPVATNTRCIAHHKAYADLAADLAAGTVANYVFITPNLCNDMHGALDCPSGIGATANIAAGDAWLATNLPPIIAYTHTHDAVIFLVWDEGDSSNLVPFLALGDHVVAGASDVTYDHGSQVKSVEVLLGLPILPAVTSSNDFAAMFAPGYF